MELAKLGDFPLSLSLRQRGGKSLSDGLAFAFVRETVIGPMAGVVGLVAMTMRIPAAAASGGDRTWTKISQTGDLIEKSLPLGFQSG